MPAVLYFCKTFVVGLGFFLKLYTRCCKFMLEQDGLEENPLYLEEKEVKFLSYYLNVSPINTGKGGNTQPLALYFRNLLIFLWGFLRRAKRLLWES